jgi:hypothetical protein
MEEAWQAVDACFGRFCLTAGVEALQAMMAADVEDLCGRRHARSPERRGHRHLFAISAPNPGTDNVDLSALIANFAARAAPVALRWLPLV